jgi:hypothetical protein
VSTATQNSAVGHETEAAVPGSSALTLLAGLLAHLIAQHPGTLARPPAERTPDDSDHR